MKIDDFEVKAEYIENPASEEITKFKVTAAFRSRHVFETQYMTAYLKCDDRTCCAAPKTHINRFFPHRRLPCLIPISKTSFGMVALPLEPEVYKSHIQFPTLTTRVVLEETITPEVLIMKYGKTIPYDAYLPSCQGKVEDRTCKVCYKYHATKKSLKMHKEVCKRSKEVSGAQKKTRGGVKQQRGRGGRGRGKKMSTYVEDTTDESSEEEINANTSSDDEDEVMEDDLETVSVRPKYSMQGEGGVETILNLREWLKSPWAEQE